MARWRPEEVYFQERRRLMRTSIVLDADTHDEIEHKLVRRLHELQKTLHAHDIETSKRLPRDDEEAAPLKSEMDVVEAEEVSEACEIGRIENALERLKKGVYGICAFCHHAIPKERLRAVPESPYCLGCQKTLERKKGEGDWPY